MPKWQLRQNSLNSEGTEIAHDHGHNQRIGSYLVAKVKCYCRTGEFAGHTRWITAERAEGAETLLIYPAAKRCAAGLLSER